jgi:hypothetical protein
MRNMVTFLWYIRYFPFFLLNLHGKEGWLWWGFRLGVRRANGKSSYHPHKRCEFNISYTDLSLKINNISFLINRSSRSLGLELVKLTFIA